MAIGSHSMVPLEPKHLRALRVIAGSKRATTALDLAKALDIYGLVRTRASEAANLAIVLVRRGLVVRAAGGGWLPTGKGWIEAVDEAKSKSRRT